MALQSHSLHSNSSARRSSTVGVPRSQDAALEDRPTVQGYLAHKNTAPLGPYSRTMPSGYTPSEKIKKYWNFRIKKTGKIRFWGGAFSGEDGTSEGGSGPCRPKQCPEPLERCCGGDLLWWSREQRPPHPGQQLILLVPSEMDPWRDRGVGLFGLPRTSQALDTPRGMLHACPVSCWVHAPPPPLRFSTIQAPFRTMSPSLEPSVLHTNLKISAAPTGSRRDNFIFF